MAPKRKKVEGLTRRLPSNPYAKFYERGSREEKMREIWGMANDQFWRARAKALQAGMPNPDNLLPLGKRGRKSDKAEKIKEEWLLAGGGGQAPKFAGVMVRLTTAHCSLTTAHLARLAHLHRTFILARSGTIPWARSRRQTRVHHDSNLCAL